jgi:hypothetical protein
MILNIHSNASYLLEEKAPNRPCGHFFMGWMTKDGEPIHLDWACHISMTILIFFVSSASKAKSEQCTTIAKRELYFARLIPLWAIGNLKPLFIPSKVSVLAQWKRIFFD